MEENPEEIEELFLQFDLSRMFFAEEEEEEEPSIVVSLRDITGRKRMEEKRAKAAEIERKRTAELEKAYKKLEDERKRLESFYAELRGSKNALIRSEKLAFTGRIAASIAHEIRNPLTNVTMSVQELKRVLKPENAEAKHHINIIFRNTKRVNYLITELLNCARPPKLNLQPYDIHRVLENVLDSTKIRLRRIEAVKRFTPKSSTLSIDKEQLERAFSNIVINAIEAMPKGGELTIDTGRYEEFFLVKIQDTGKGIPEKDIMRIFDPFFSSKRGGVGLGLTLSYGIIVSHGGTIEVESKPRKGSIFTVSLPM